MSTSSLHFTILPSLGLGDIKLGTSLNENIKLLEKINIRFIFNPSKLLNSNYIVQLKNCGINLIFNSIDQLLILIEINIIKSSIKDNYNYNYNINNIRLIYNNNFINSMVLQNLYNNIFGPTNQGDFQNDDYYLSYPGLTLIFKNVSKLYQINTNNMVEFINRNDLICDRILIHQFEKYSKYSIDSDINNQIKRSYYNLNLLNSIEIDQLNNIKLSFYNISKQNSFEINLKLQITLQEEILNKIGPPDEIFIKNDNKLNIHNRYNSSSASNDNNNDNVINNDVNTGEIFHNYFNYGFDLLYDCNYKSGSKLSKLIIHNNLPTSIKFGKYNKPIKISINGVNNILNQSFDQINTNFDIETSNPILINKSIEKFQSFQIIFNIDDDIDLNQKNLIYIENNSNRIWEILNNCIESITLY
ncbi:hypothetical protein WICMUC_004541 [Wickerhamomyces mucosus]|uniref:Uncharacterized protein n=1 Tax=Wickerhamomyces mucosus TaxID=1378264 RepID=A0A9P8PGG0_9ASCO|nr:hypothetical protein WICMUC_004541 [Wickerhamomyces mucosus]